MASVNHVEAIMLQPIQPDALVFWATLILCALGALAR